jgi:anti-sigma B factor antagonist
MKARLVRFNGDLDIATAPQLQRALDDAAGADVVRLDLSRVTFMDSSGLHVLVRAHAMATTAGTRLIISGALQPAVRRTLELSGVGDLLEVGPAHEAHRRHVPGGSRFRAGQDRVVSDWLQRLRG